VKRAQAIALLVEAELPALTRAERESMLLDYWALDEDDDEFGELPELLRAELRRGGDPGDPMAAKYEPLLALALRARYIGVVHAYLEAALARLGHGAVKVEGTVELLEPCP
jgi:hypothetical protein